MKASSEPTADDSSTEAMRSPSLTKSALGGVAWNSAGSAVLVLAQIASTIATARLVSPHEFGFYATAQAAAGVVGYVFTISALGSGIQRRSRLGEKTVGTALTLSLASSLVVGGGLFAGASLWARVWGVPEAAAVVRVIALTSLPHVRSSDPCCSDPASTGVRSGRDHRDLLAGCGDGRWCSPRD